jgi:23S rRNA pseudouridine2605 synthase
VNQIRLNRFVASCGITSRRKAEALILQGRVRIDGKIVILPSFRIDVDTMEVTLDGKRLRFEPLVYLVMNKPAGVVCAVEDKYDPVVVDLLPAEWRELRVFPVGRLDRESEGLLILSNDGDFAQKLTHPSHSISREYEVRLARPIDERTMTLWRAGYTIEGRFVKPIKLERLQRLPPDEWLCISIGEGVKREVRMMARLSGHRVLSLFRRKIGKMELEDLQRGQVLGLSQCELWSKILEGGSV